MHSLTTCPASEGKSNLERMILRDARPEEIDAILSHTQALWGDGLPLAAYREFVGSLMQTGWAKTSPGNYRFLVLKESEKGDSLAALKLYRFGARLLGERISVSGVGAVFTLPACRRRGHAAQMLRLAHGIMRQRGDALSLLFSEIGPDYYARQGYRRLPSCEAWIRVPSASSPPSRPNRMRGDQVERVARIRDAEDEDAPFSLVREIDYWKYLLARASYPTLHFGTESWESRVALAGDEGYLWSMFKSGGGMSAELLEFGEMRPREVLPALLDDLFEECRGRGVARVHTWLPPALAARDPRLRTAPEARLAPEPHGSSVSAMWLPLDERITPLLMSCEERVSFHLTDLF